MYKHILLPNDGSELSARAVQEGVRFAKSINAQVTALHVTGLFFPSGMPSYADVVAKVREHEQRAAESAKRALGAVEEAARSAGVTCTVLHRSSDNPWEEIIKVATERGCDLIFMASHGRRGVGALLLGSETNKVLTHSTIPVLVCR
jgi:nucleotide-binding universal stress UspA family protein